MDSLNGQTVLLTGAAGFLGKAILERLLRACAAGQGPASIRVLLRAKRNADATQRLKEITRSGAFDSLRQAVGQDFESLVRRHVEPMTGDMECEGLGIDERSRRSLSEVASVILHCAASVRFDGRLDEDLNVNVHGPLRLLEFARTCRRLGAFVHVSTAYVIANRRDGLTKEQVEPLGFNARDFVEEAKGASPEAKAAMTRFLLGERGFPNMYTATKAIAEQLLVEGAGDLPLVVCRPSIVGCAWQQPMAGWTDSITGVNGVCASVLRGALKIGEGRGDLRLDIAPLDYCVGVILASAVFAQALRQSGVRVVNCTTSRSNPALEMDETTEIWCQWGRQHPSPRNVAEPRYRVLPSWQYRAERALCYDVPNLALRSLAAAWPHEVLRDASHKFTKLCATTAKLHDAYRPFQMGDWSFETGNRELLGRLVVEAKLDPSIYSADLVETLDWRRYQQVMCGGVWKYLLKESDAGPLESAPREAPRAMVRMLLTSTAEASAAAPAAILKALGAAAAGAWACLQKSASWSFC